MTRGTSALLVVFLASLAVDWPVLRGGARLAELLMVPLVVAVAWCRTVTPRWHALDGFVLLYMAGSVASFAATTDPQASTVEWLRQAYLVVVYAVVACVTQAVGTRWAVRGLLASGMTLAVVGVAFAVARLFASLDVPLVGEVMHLPYLGGVLRLRALTSSPAMLACLLTMTAPLALLWAHGQARARRLAAAAAAVMMMAAVLTFSHALAGLLVGCLFLWAPSLRRSVRIGFAAVVVAAVLLLNAFIAASVRSVAIDGKSLADPTAYTYGVDHGSLQVGRVTIDYEVMSYLRIKTIALDAFWDRPLTGVGLDRFHAVTTSAYESDRLPFRYRAIDPHSTLLGRMAETGAVGGATLIALWVSIGVVAARATRNDRAQASVSRALAAGLLGLLVNSVNVDIMNFRFAWAALGVLRAIDASDSLAPLQVSDSCQEGRYAHRF